MTVAVYQGLWWLQPWISLNRTFLNKKLCLSLGLIQISLVACVVAVCLQFWGRRFLSYNSLGINLHLERKLLPSYVSFKSSLCTYHFLYVVLKDLEQLQLADAAAALARKTAFLGLVLHQREADLFPCHASASQDSKPLGKQCLLVFPWHCSYVL